MQCKEVGKKCINYLASSIASAKSLSSPEMELEIVGKGFSSSPFCSWKTRTNSIEKEMRKDFCPMIWTNLCGMLCFWLAINEERTQNAFFSVFGSTTSYSEAAIKTSSPLEPILVTAGLTNFSKHVCYSVLKRYGCQIKFKTYLCHIKFYVLQKFLLKM